MYIAPSRQQIKRAGLTVIDPATSVEEKDKAIELIQAWRSKHTTVLDNFQKLIKRQVKKNNFKSVIVAQRLKRMSSIIAKLDRFKQMNLARMQDIAGIRVVLPNIQNVYELHESLLKGKLAHKPVLPPDDYIASPKPDGYRSLHQVFKYTSAHQELNDLSVELQIRTKLQHSWATAVETIGAIQEAPYKSGGGDEEIKRFFKLVSAIFSLKEGCAVLEEFQDWTESTLIAQAKDIEERHQICLKLRGVAITAKHIESVTSKDAYYQLLVLKKSDDHIWNVSVTGFTKKQEELAKLTYSIQERASRSIDHEDVVLISVGDLRSIKKAYPNYFLDTADFVKVLQGLFKSQQ